MLLRLLLSHICYKSIEFIIKPISNIFASDINKRRFNQTKQTMNYFELKIKEHLLSSVREGTRNHEYRLATQERRLIRIGDVLILKNNQNLRDYVKVRVKSIEIFDSWERALQKNWEADFKYLFDNFEQAIHECYKFYSAERVRENGIIVFEIEPYIIELKKSAVLLDTNIVIHRESSNNIASDVIQLYKSLDKLKSNKYVLEDIKDEIKKHKDKAVVSNMLSKLEAYSFLDSPSNNDKRFNDVVSRYSSDENSMIDNKYLYQVYKGRVDFLITDDRGILSKARDLFIDDIVMSSSSFLSLVEERYPSLINYDVLSIKPHRFSSLDLNDDFFETLREDYKGIEFNRWFEKKARDGESAYVFKNGNGLQGFLYLKIEDKNDTSNRDIEPLFEPKKRLKVGSFKINSTGLRVGERFLKIIFDYAQKGNVEEIYVTLFANRRPEVKALMNLMMDWGFEKYGHKTTSGELVLVKRMDVYRKEKSPKFNYPMVKPDASCGVLPIDSQFHTDLFPDLYLKNESMILFADKPCRYAIEKIYVCSTRTIPLRPGDLMAIYYISPSFYKAYNSVVSGVCILQEILYPSSYEDFLKTCTNRSVFDEKQLRHFYFEKRYRTVLKVLFLKPLNKKVVLSDLYGRNIIDREKGPRLRTTILREKFEELLRIGGIQKL